MLMTNSVGDPPPPARHSPPTRVLIVLRDFNMGGSLRQAALIANRLHTLTAATVEVWAFEYGRAVHDLLLPEITTRVLHPGSAGSALQRAHDLGRFLLALRSARADVLLPFNDFPNRVVGSLWPLTGAAACVWNQRDEGREVTQRPLERLAIRQSTCFVANSNVGRSHLVSTFGVPEGRISIIRNGVAPPSIALDRTSARRTLDLDAGTPVAVMVANTHRFKDHETLVHAWRLVVDGLAEPPLLLLAGRPGDRHARIVELGAQLGLEQSIRLLGEVADVWPLLAASDIAVFSSRREGCPNAVLEAMAAGLPVVATDIVGTREALGDTYPYLVPPGDPRALADSIRNLLAHPAERAALAGRNRNRVACEFSPQSAADAYASLVSRLLRPGRCTASP